MKDEMEKDGLERQRGEGLVSPVHVLSDAMLL